VFDWYNDNPDRKLSPEDQLSPASRYYLRHAEKLANKLKS
jgi:hypothetical protein